MPFKEQAAWSEPRQDFWQDRRRTDIFAVLGPKSYHIDVRVTHPTSLSYVQVACQGPLRAAELAAQEKRRRYAALAHADGAEFVPFVVETFGGFRKDARAFISDLAKFAVTSSRVWSAAETRFMVRAEVHRALFEGNLRVANAVLPESRSATRRVDIMRLRRVPVGHQPKAMNLTQRTGRQQIQRSPQPQLWC